MLQPQLLQLYAHARLGSAPPRLEVCLLVDNSGSMGSKAGPTRQAVALLMEVLRRLELRWAVVRFDKGQQVGLAAQSACLPAGLRALLPLGLG